jgi:hydrogen peroxide-dependent heme synthase
VNEPLIARQGWGVLHLFCRLGLAAELEPVAAAVKSAASDDLQVVPFSVFGHKADLGFLAVGSDWVRLRQFQAHLQAAGLEVVDSYLSLTEVSEYAGDLPPERTEPRLHPVLPPEGKRAFSFYPMTKRRGEVHNWYALDFEQRRSLMGDHGRSGRRFAGRIVQLITGSTGLDDFEWGVTLFGVHPDDLKDTVYTMRYDEASALYGEFGTFYTGIVGTVEEVAAQVGLV